jgi:GMP synthase-like glutamine amidotransferase
VQATHVEAVLELPAGARLLARATRIRTRRSPSASAPGTWFHPEFDADVVRAYLGARRLLLAERSRPGGARARRQRQPHGVALLRRFAGLLRD